MRLALSGYLLSGVVCAALAIPAPAASCQAAATAARDKAPAADAKPAEPQASKAPHFPTNEDLRHLKSLSAPLLSPDGKLVLFTVTEPTADGAKAHLWVSPVGVGAEKARQITFSAPDQHGERSAQWAPDGSAVYFLAKRGEHTQLFRLDMRGGEAAPYDLKIAPPVDDSKEKNAIPPAGAGAASAADKSSDKKAEAKPAEKKQDADGDKLPLDVSGYALSPDGKWLAVWAHDPETPGEKKQKTEKADAEWVNHETHATRLYLAALKADGVLNGIVDGDLKAVGVAPDVHTVVWSPVADRMVVITEGPNDVSDLGPAGAAWLVSPAAPEKVLRLDGIPPTVGGGAAWRPDGGEVVFVANTPEDAPPGYDELFALPIDANGVGVGAARRLSADFAGQANGVALYFPGNGTVVALAGVKTRMMPVEISLEGKAKPAIVDLGAQVVSGLNTNRKQTGWVWIADSGGKTPGLCYAMHLGDSCSPVNTPEPEPAGLIAVKPELVEWKSGGFTIDGLLYMPVSANESAKVPLVVDVHGGPFGAFEDRNDPFVAFLVGHGWAVLRPNPRGSSNYGLKFAAANKNDLGGGDYLDVMAGVDAVLAKYPVDPNRLALMGYSYGGEMAAFVEGKTDRFKAIISCAPVIDQFSEYGTEGGSWYDRWYFGKPWEHLEDAWRQSPLAGAAKAKTPFMLIQGQSDTTDPLGQAQEMYRALRQEGIPVELVTYPRENHGPLGGGIFGRPSTEPWHGFDARQRMVEFLSKGFGEKTPDAAKP
jgi:dipeptidyl aminopeptidase/acylaminoacyl peptidase